MDLNQFTIIVDLLKDNVDDAQIALRLGITIEQVKEVRKYVEEEHYADFE